MNKPKLNGLQKTISLILAAIILILAIGFAASGWDGSQNKSDENSGNVGDKTDNTEENKNPTQSDANATLPTDKPDDSVGTQAPVYKNKLTGIQISQHEYETAPIAVVIDSASSFYGVSSSDLVIEFPIECGGSRLLCYSSNEEILWKIGSLKATKNYISSTSGFFGGVVVCYGAEESIYFDVWETDKIVLDLSQYSDCYYTENTLYVYTTETMIDAAENRLPLDTNISVYKDPPYLISEDEKILGITNANTITIPYSAENSSQLRYNANTCEYEYLKFGKASMDMLNGKIVSFANVFVLFANSITYESIDGIELNIDIISGGNGYYASLGMVTEFTWFTDSNGDLHFQRLDGTELKVNVGTAYMAYYKASGIKEIEIS